ncbi:MAG: hypothetical protein C0497_07820 [Gemmatimonas sp.]|nr:hypothetical protein [Gemmatimonas sp.]
MGLLLASCASFTGLTGLSACVQPAWAQQQVAARSGVGPFRWDAESSPARWAGWSAAAVSRAVAVPGVGQPGDPRLSEAERRRWAPVASLILPGAGQALLTQDRFVAYLALEAWAVLEFANQRTEARRQRDRYRALARDVARSLYGPSRPVGQWAYYESMQYYLESGVFDRTPGGEVDPDINPDTYNGAMWQMARTTYWRDPSVPPLLSSSEYRRAINFYLDRAVRPEYRWSWRNAQFEQDLYIRTIRRSNTSFREARAALSVVLANHLLSAVDAVIALRIEGLEGSDGRGFALRGSLPIP